MLLRKATSLGWWSLGDVTSNLITPLTWKPLFEFSRRGVINRSPQRCHKEAAPQNLVNFTSEIYLPMIPNLLTSYHQKPMKKMTKEEKTSNSFFSPIVARSSTKKVKRTKEFSEQQMPKKSARTNVRPRLSSSYLLTQLLSLAPPLSEQLFCCPQ